MHWILQDNLFNEQAYDVMVDMLVRFDIPHSIHKVIPFVGELTPSPELDTTNVICMGSYSLRHSAKKFNWVPGVFDLEEMTFEVQLEHWGDEMLNAQSVVTTFGEATVKDIAFLRPVADSKVFAGRIFDEEEFTEWQKKVCVLHEDFGDSLTSNTLIQVAHPRKIYMEARFWIVRGEIVTQSIYKRGDMVIYLPDVPQSYTDYVTAMIQQWQPAEAFVIDVCETENGMKIVEINTLNSAGFYAGDVQKLVSTLEENFTTL